MTGLLDKDLRLILQRKQAIIMFLVIAVILGFSTGGIFVVPYTSFCIIMIAVGTISYYEFDNGYSFLMTLPITKKTYVIEKYILCTALGILAWLFSIAVCIIEYQYKPGEEALSDLLMQAVIVLPLIIVLMDFMIPVQIKFGAEKSRLALIVVMGVVGVAILGFNKIVGKLDLPVDSIVEKISGITDEQALILFILLAVIATLVSICVSLKIMNNKEF